MGVPVIPTKFLTLLQLESLAANGGSRVLLLITAPVVLSMMRTMLAVDMRTTNSLLVPDGVYTNGPA